MTMQAQIIPQYVNPRSQQSGANIKDVNGAKWYIPDSAVALFQPQVPVNIEYDSRTSRRGTAYQTVTAVNGQAVGRGPQAQSVPPQYATPPPSGYVPVAPTAPIAPAVAPQATVQPSMDKSEEIFVTGVVQQAMSTGKYEASDIPLLAKAATQAWRERTQYQQNGSDPSEPPPPEYDGPDDGWPGPT